MTSPTEANGLSETSGKAEIAETPAHGNELERSVHPQDAILPLDSAMTRAEKVERHGHDDFHESPQKRRKVEADGSAEPELFPENDGSPDASKDIHRSVMVERKKGEAPIKAEFRINSTDLRSVRSAGFDDDAAEGAGHAPSDDTHGKKKNKSRGLNVKRDFGSSKDEIELCGSRTTQPEFSPGVCKFGGTCKFEHDLRKYLKEHKRSDLTTFDGICPIWQTHGSCDRGWTCRFVGSHMSEQATEDGRRELVLTTKENAEGKSNGSQLLGHGLNIVSPEIKNGLMKRKIQTPRADAYTNWIEIHAKELQSRQYQWKGPSADDSDSTKALQDDSTDEPVNRNRRDSHMLHDDRANYTEPPFLPSEKRRVYFGPETPALAPLTTQGNRPFRRLCVDLGAQLTYSEMAVSLPLVQGAKSEWALLGANPSEGLPPAHRPSSSPTASSQKAYDNNTDMRFGAQIAANKPWVALKATELLTRYCSHLRVIDLNCGCPIDLVYRQGAGSALLDSQSKLEKILRGMNAVSDSIPITCKIRMGVKDNHPTALKLVDRLCLGNPEEPELGGAGVAAITLHGRSRQQRYTKAADWEYIANCASLIHSYQSRSASLVDTIRQPDPRTLSSGGKLDGSPYFLGNGDCYSHEDYNAHLSSAGVDAVMIGRGAIVKPWLFEEISAGQYLDKSASERLTYVEKFVRYGLETWGSDERGIGLTRRFLLEWLSFAYRYVPVGILEYLPPSLQDRPPAWRGRNDLESLLGSDDYKDWIKIRYVHQEILSSACFYAVKIPIKKECLKRPAPLR